MLPKIVAAVAVGLALISCSGPKQLPEGTPTPSAPVVASPAARPSPSATALPPRVVTITGAPNVEPATLVRPGATIEQVVAAEMVPGEPPVYAIVSSLPPLEGCRFAKSRRRYLDLYRYSAESQTWVETMDGDSWPTGENPLVTPGVASSKVAWKDCLAIHDVVLTPVRMRPDREFIFVYTHVNPGGVSTWPSAGHFLGFVEGSLTLLASIQASGGMLVEARGPDVVVLHRLLLSRDANCCASASSELTFHFDNVINQIAHKTLTAPNCREGVVRSIRRDEIVAGVFGAGTLEIECDAAPFLRSNYALDYLGPNVSQLKPNDRVRIDEYAEIRPRFSEYPSDLAVRKLIILQ